LASILKIVAYFLGTLVLGALLAPWLYWGGQAAGGLGALAWLRDVPFQRYFDRAMLIAAIALLWPVVKSLRIGGWQELGLRRNPHAWRQAGMGFSLSAGLLWMLGLLLWHERIYAPSGQLTGQTLIEFMVTALAVGLLEEAFFRGALLGLVGRTASPGMSVGFVSALFAIVHFLKPPAEAYSGHAITWVSGFEFLPLTFWQFSNPLLVAGGFTTLFAVGWVLGWARLRTQSLWLPIGLHAGWVFGLKTFSKRSEHLAHSNLWIGGDLLHGLAPVLAVIITGAVLWLILKLRAPADSI
jgi:membrane protease YdiL (CAAX protease family)